MSTQRAEQLVLYSGFQSLPERTRGWILQSAHAQADFAEFFARGGRVEPAQSVDLPYYHATQPPKIYIGARAYADLTGPNAAQYVDAELRLFATLAHEIGHDKHNPGTEPFGGRTAEEYVQYRSQLEAKTVFNAFPIFDDLQKTDPEFRVRWDAVGYGRGSGLEPAGIYSEWKAGRISEATAIAHLAAPIPDFPYTRNEPLTDQNGDGVLTQRDVYLRDHRALVQRLPNLEGAGSDKQEAGGDRVQLGPARPGHQDHGLYSQIASHVREQDRQHGRQWDGTSERMTASLLALAKESGLSQVGHVVFSAGTDRAAAGENVFLVQGRLDDPAHVRTHMKTEEAVRTPEAMSFARVEAMNERRAEQGIEPQVSRPMPDETQKPPGIGR